MGNTQTNEKQSKTGKSPAKGKHFIKNLNRKSPGRESKKHGRKKGEGKRETINREFDKTPDSDNMEVIETSDNDTVECSLKTLQEGEGEWSVQSEVTVSRCERSVTRVVAAASSPADHSTSESVFTDPLAAAVELNHCYYSAESDTPATSEPYTPEQQLAPAQLAAIDMPHDDATSSLATDDAEKEEKNDVFYDNIDKVENNEKIMGAVYTKPRTQEEIQKRSHECDHDFLDNRLKPTTPHISFTLSKHRKVELPPVACESSLTLLEDDTDRDRRHSSSVSDVPMVESNVLRKVASLTLDKHSESKVARSKFLPDKIDFRLYQKFEGQMLLNSFTSSVAGNKHLKNSLSPHELKNLIIQFCTHLLEAGVIIQIPDKDAPLENVFKPSVMYYWAHMDAPECQPITPGRHHTTSWPPDKDQLCMEKDNKSQVDNIQFFSSNNNEEINDITEAKIYISQLQKKIHDLENEIEKMKINTQIEELNKNLNKEYDILSDINSPKNKNNVVYHVSEIKRFDSKPVITIPEQPIKTNTVKNLDVNNLDSKNEISSTPEVRSDKIENYCKLNKSREYNKKNRNSLVKSLADNDFDSSIILDECLKDTNSELEMNVRHDNSSEASFRSIKCSSLDITTNNDRIMDDTMDIQKFNKPFSSSHIPTTHLLYSNTDYMDPVSYDGHNISSLEHDSLIFIESELKKQDNIKEESEKKSYNEVPVSTESSTDKFLDIEPCTVTNDHSIVSPPPPHPGMPPPPPPMPGTDTLEDQKEDISENTRQSSQILENEQMLTVQKMPSPVLSTKCSPQLSETCPPTPPMSDPESSQTPQDRQVSPSITKPSPQREMGQMPLIPGIGPPPPPMPVMGPPPPPPMPGISPPPPPMPGIGPPPPPMPGMCPPPPPLPGMGPPPPPLPGMGPPPPPMPGMGPPPPPMPGMGPPPPPLMPGMCPPPPPIMPGSGPPPPPGSVPPPPPSNSGPLPFPAPPAGGWNMQRATLRKTPVKPAAPMKPLYWTRILAMPPPAVVETETVPVKPLWLEIEETKLDNIDEFTDLFSRQVIKAPVKKKVEVKTKIQPIKILDSKRSQNVGILAQSLHVEFSEIENAIYNFDTSVVSLEALQQIHELRATDEELAKIREHLNKKPDIPLDKPEAFLYDLSGIPNFADRISCFMFQADFEDSVSTTMHKLDNLKHTCEFLMTSESLKKLFAIILTLGNYMNGGNGQRGQADGFGLEILSKLKDVKSKQSNVTLLHFIVRTYMRSCGGALSETCTLPVPEPGDVARASTLDFADVASHLDTLTKQLTACKEKTKKIIDADAESRSQGDECTEGKKRLEVFKDKMTTFLNAAEEKLKTENENLDDCKTKFIATVKFYQYSPKCGKLEDCEPKEFFSLWTSFCSDFKDIYKKEEQLAIKEKLKEAKKLKDERKSLTQPKKEGGLKARLQKLSSTKK